jgi:hypothetical protein
MRVFHTPNSRLKKFLLHGWLATTARQRSVNGAELIPAKSHDVLPEWTPKSGWKKALRLNGLVAVVLLKSDQTRLSESPQVLMSWSNVVA